MIRLILLLAAMAVFTHCTDGRSPVKVDGAGTNDAGAVVVQAAEKTGAVLTDTAASQRAYVDPETGKLIPRPAQEAAAERVSAQPSALGCPDDEEEVKPSPVKDGGIMVDLKGRFQNPIKATVDEQGGSRIEHPDENRAE